MSSQNNRLSIERAIREKAEQVNYTRKSYIVKELVERYEKDLLFVPDYQREDVWSYEMKSSFIESIILDLPMNYLYFAEPPRDAEDFSRQKYEILDGSQRIRTLSAFLTNRLRVSHPKSILELKDCYFKDLTESRQDRIKNFRMDAIVLVAETQEKLKNALFERLNTHNPLKDMELRRGAHTGHFNDLVRELGEVLSAQPYKTLCPISQYFADRKEEEELVLRFFAFSETFESELSFKDSTGIKIKKQSTSKYLTDFYAWQNERLAALKRKNVLEYEREVQRLKNNFTKMLDFVKQSFSFGFRRDGKAKSVSRLIFESISVGVHLALTERENLSTDIASGAKVLKNKEFKHFVNQKYKGHETQTILKRIALVRDILLSENNN
jgi:hypothetical protein